MPCIAEKGAPRLIIRARVGRPGETYRIDVTTNPDSNLVEAASRGDAESFSRLCERHYAALVAVAYSQLADRSLAEDAAQEALLAAYRDIRGLKQPERFAAWLTSICRNIAIDMAKARAREKHAQTVDGSGVLNPSRHETDTVGVVREIILRLDAQMRDIVYLKYYGRLSYGRIAQMLGISEEAVNGRLRRARDKVRRELRRRASTEKEP
jgi:RNA polymerase sigma factor (sigma-70 family)